MLRYLIVTFVLILFAYTHAETKYTISGYIRDAKSGEELIGTTVYVKALKAGTSSNVYGFYSLTIPTGKHMIRYNMIGYDPFEVEIDLTQDIERNVELIISAVKGQDEIVTAETPDENVKSTEMSAVSINPVQIKSVPVLFGERDLLKTMQLLPGIKAVGEGNSGFHVRGGGPDQNLLLLDEGVVYNAAHFLGFFSVFNSDAIKDAKLYMGSAPAKYGGRLSSVLDMKMKEGNSKDLSFDGGIGLISSRLTVQGPIKKDVSSFIISGRRTYADLFLKLSSDESIRKTELYFYDLNLKTNYRVGKNDRLYLSGYFGRDVLGYANEFGIDWGNIVGTLRWNHLFNNKHFLNTSLIYSKYDYTVGLSNGDELVELKSSITNLSLREDFELFIDANNKLSYGLDLNYHKFIPGKINASENSSINSMKIKEKYGLENAVYINHSFKFSEMLHLDYGLRYSTLFVLGPGRYFEFNDEGDILDTLDYSSGELVASYGGIEPRVTVNYIYSNESSYKASYARNRQYLHLLSNTTMSTPFDLWHPSTNNVKPGISDQYAIGYFRNFNDNMYETSLELYYKDMKNQIDFETGADISFNEMVESEIAFGKARSYGVEFLIKKKQGRFTGWLSYALTKTEKQFEEIEGDRWYPARQDRTHDIAIVGMYQLNNNWKLSGTWVYYTGNAVTFPEGRYVIDDHLVNLYTSRNSYRMPAYHRLDLGLTWEKARSSWNFSLYNAYGRRNAYSIQFRQNEDNPAITEAVRIALFSFFPSITYNFRF